MKRLFTTVAGNRKLCEKLGNDVLNNSLPHAIILEGARGSGKHTIAKLCAASLVCENKHKADAPLPCLECLSCRKIIDGKSPDLITVNREDKATFSVDRIRFIKEDVHVVPNDSDYKIYLIEEGEKMTPQAQNAFLLTLEEPPKYAHFFILCEKADTLLETIRSRAPILRTEPLSNEAIDEYLTATDRRAAQMKATNKDAYDELITASASTIGRALEFLDKDAFQSTKKSRTLVARFIDAALSGKGAKAVLPITNKFSSSRESLIETLSLVSSALRDLIALKKYEEAPLLFFSNRDDAIEMSDKATLSHLYTISTNIDTAIDELTRNANAKLVITKFLMTSKII